MSSKLAAMCESSASSAQGREVFFHFLMSTVRYFHELIREQDTACPDERPDSRLPGVARRVTKPKPQEVEASTSSSKAALDEMARDYAMLLLTVSNYECNQDDRIFFECLLRFVFEICKIYVRNESHWPLMHKQLTLMLCGERPPVAPPTPPEGGQLHRPSRLSPRRSFEARFRHTNKLGHGETNAVAQATRFLPFSPPPYRGLAATRIYSSH